MGQVTSEHEAHGKLKSSPTTNLVKSITYSDGRTVEYEYDPEERITKVTDSVDGVTEYTYDALGQLLTETHDGTVVSTMTYDGYGNIQSKNGIAYQYDSVWKDKLTQYGNESITYDAGGNPLSYRGFTFTWEKGRQLQKAVKDGVTCRYTYNATGIRTRKMVGDVEHNYILDGANIIEDRYCGNTLRVLYDNENAVCGIVYNGLSYYFTKNLQGDIIAISDENANIVARYRYDAWGVCTIVEDTSTIGIATINPFRYRGYYLDVETGLYYLQSRYYDPAVGRFINADMPTLMRWSKKKLKTNLFTYCNNAPIQLRDRFGFCSDDGNNTSGTTESIWDKIKDHWFPVQYGFDGFEESVYDTITAWADKFLDPSKLHEHGAMILRVRILMEVFYCFGPVYKGFRVNAKWETVIQGLYLSGLLSSLSKMLIDLLGLCGLIMRIDYFGFIHSHTAGDTTPGPSGPDYWMPRIPIFVLGSVFPVIDYDQYKSKKIIYYV